MSSFAEGLQDGAQLFMNFKANERQDRLAEQQMAESKFRLEASQREEERTVRQAKISAANSRYAALVKQEDDLRRMGVDEKEIASKLAPEYARLTDATKGFKGDNELRGGNRDMLDAKVGADGSIMFLVQNNDTGTTGLMTEGGKPLGQGGVPAKMKNLEELRLRVGSQLAAGATAEGLVWNEVTNPDRQRKIEQIDATKRMQSVATLTGRTVGAAPSAPPGPGVVSPAGAPVPGPGVPGATPAPAPAPAPATSYQSEGIKQGPDAVHNMIVKALEQGATDEQILASGNISQEQLSRAKGAGAPHANDNAVAVEPPASAPDKVSAGSVVATPEAFKFVPRKRSTSGQMGRRGKAARTPEQLAAMETAAREELASAKAKADDLSAQAEETGSDNLKRAAENWAAHAERLAATNFVGADGKPGKPLPGAAPAVAEQSASEQNAMITAAETKAKLADQAAERDGGWTPETGLVAPQMPRAAAASAVAMVVDPRALSREQFRAMVDLHASGDLSVADAIKLMTPPEQETGKWHVTKNVMYNDASGKWFLIPGAATSTSGGSGGGGSDAELKLDKAVFDAFSKGFKANGIDAEYSASYIREINSTNWQALGLDKQQLANPMLATELVTMMERARAENRDVNSWLNSLATMVGAGKQLATSFQAMVSAKSYGLDVDTVALRANKLFKKYEDTPGIKKLPVGVWTSAVGVAAQYDLPAGKLIEAYASIKQSVGNDPRATEAFIWGQAVKFVASPQPI